MARTYNLDIVPGGSPVVVPANQYEHGDTITFTITDNGDPFTVPNTAAVTIRGTKPDGKGFDVSCTVSGGAVRVVITEQMVAAEGDTLTELKIVDSDKTLFTGNFILRVERSALDSDTILSESELAKYETVVSQVTAAVSKCKASEESCGISQAKAAAAAQSAVQIAAGKIIDSVYPVGSIYMSVTATSPADFIGGTWESISGRFLLAADTSHEAGTTGGEETHTLTVDEMPAHQHNINQNATATGGTYKSGYVPWGTARSGNAYHTLTVGGGGAHNNMPPYLAVYMWKRTA